MRKSYIIEDDNVVYYAKYNVDVYGREHGKIVYWRINEANCPTVKANEYTYLHGVLDGYYCRYFEDGVTLKEEGTYVNGKLDGDMVVYNRDQSVFVRCRFENGLLNGWFTAWKDWKNGVLMERIMCRDDKPSYRYVYDDEGHMLQEKYYNSAGECIEEVKYDRLPTVCNITRFNYETGSMRKDTATLI
jgi:antitoxin component YwqK of YwqJK toxin-antitoxin module